MSSLVSCLCDQLDFNLSHCLQRTNSHLSPTADPDTPVFSGSGQCLFSPPLDTHLVVASATPGGRESGNHTTTSLHRPDQCLVRATHTSLEFFLSWDRGWAPLNYGFVQSACPLVAVNS